MSRNLIPAEALDKHIALLGGTGSGKTSTAKVAIVEPALTAGERVVVIDPTSAWWGLRLGRDGKAKGFPIYIFGGDHGDYPLRARDAEILADAFATSSDSAVFDTSLMTVTERTQFFTDFAEAIRRKNRGPLKVVIDEAHLFMPQSGAKTGGAVPAMLHAGNNLVSLGRSRGLRITLISQRPAKLHKDSLTQVQTLVAMRLMAPQDRAAIADWVADQADPSKGKEIIASLPGLKPGEGWVWAPLAGVLDRVAFPMPRTFDSSRAPDAADGKGPSLAPINLDALKGRLATVEAEVRANDPKALKAEVARLKSELAKASKPVEKINTPDQKAQDRALAAARQEGIAAGWEEGDRSGFARGAEVALSQGFQAIQGAMKAFVGVQFVPPKRAPNVPKVLPASAAAATARLQPAAAPRHAARSPVAAARQGAGTVALPPGERAVLIAAAQFDGVEREQLTILTGYKRSSRDAYIQRLREKGLVEANGSTITITDAGAAALPPDYEPLPTGTDLQAYWLGRLPEGERRILEALIQAYPDAVERTDLDESTGYKRSSRDAYLQRMKAKRLWDPAGSGVRAAEILFG